MNPTLILTPKLSISLNSDQSKSEVLSCRRRIMRVRCSSGQKEGSGEGMRFKDALPGIVGEQVEELLKREENKKLLDDLAKASQRVEIARMELAEIEKQENEALRMKAYVNQLQTRASEVRS